MPAAELLLVLGTWWVGFLLHVGRAYAEFRGHARVAEFLRARALPGQSALLEPTGVIGQENPLRVVGEVGLASPDVARRRRGEAGWYADVVAAQRPDWLVVRPQPLADAAGFAGAGRPFRGAGERDSLLAGYERALPARAGDAQGLLVLHRRGAALAP